MGAMFSKAVQKATSSIFTDTDPYMELQKTGSGVIDVRGDFVWSFTDKSKIINEIPAVYLTELEVTQNSLISAAKYYLLNMANVAAVPGVTAITSWIKDLLSKGQQNNAPQKNVGDQLGSGGGSKDMLGKYLSTYEGLYSTTPTNFKYILPYFSNNAFVAGNDWAESQQKESSPLMVGPALNQGMDMVDEAFATANLLQPGTFIEKPKYFQYPHSGEQITVTFPLLNTYNKGSASGVKPFQQNYEFLWMFTYQNKPYRTSFSRILPPKIYTLKIPGYKFMPYCYVSSLKVDFQGTRRRLLVDTPMTSGVDAIIPDAYIVSITFTGLLADLGNMMISDGFVTTSTK